MALFVTCWAISVELFSIYYVFFLFLLWKSCQHVKERLSAFFTQRYNVEFFMTDLYLCSLFLTKTHHVCVWQPVNVLKTIPHSLKQTCTVSILVCSLVVFFFFCTTLSCKLWHLLLLQPSLSPLESQSVCDGRCVLLHEELTKQGLHKLHRAPLILHCGDQWKNNCEHWAVQHIYSVTRGTT